MKHIYSNPEEPWEQRLVGPGLRHIQRKRNSTSPSCFWDSDITVTLRDRGCSAGAPCRQCDLHSAGTATEATEDSPKDRRQSFHLLGEHLQNYNPELQSHICNTPVSK